MGFWPRMDPALHPDGNRRVAGLASRWMVTSTRPTALVHPSVDPERPLDTPVLRPPPTRPGLRRNPRVARRHLHHPRQLLARLPPRRNPPHPLPPLGRLRLLPQLHPLADEPINLKPAAPPTGLSLPSTLRTEPRSRPRSNRWLTASPPFSPASSATVTPRFPALPMLALNRDPLRAPTRFKIDSSVRIRSACTSHLGADVPKQHAHRVFELKPIQGSKVTHNLMGIRVSLSVTCPCGRSGPSPPLQNRGNVAPWDLAKSA